MSNIGQMIQQHNLNQDKDYAGNLLAYAMGATGDFTIQNGNAQYSPGGVMPSKTEAWNNYIQMKKGHVSGEDLMKFNQWYSQAQGIQTENQIQELNKLQMQGVSNKDVQNLVANNDQMYNNMLDMVTQLESSGDEQGFQRAQMLRNYLPVEDEGGIIGGMLDDGVGLGDVAGLGLAGAAGVGAYGHLTGRDPELIKSEGGAFRREAGKSYKTVRQNRLELNQAVQARADKLNRYPNLTRAKRDILNERITKAQNNLYSSQDVHRETFGRKALESKVPTRGRGMMDWMKKTKGAVPTATILGMLAAQPIGRALGGEAGAQTARGGVNLAMLASAARTLGPALMGKGIHGSLLSAALMGGFGAYDLYQQYSGN